MLKLAKSTNAQETDTALGANETTRSFTILFGTALVSFVGSISAQTITTQVSPGGKSGTFGPYYADGPSGAPELVTVTATELANSTDVFTRAFKGDGQTFRFVMSNGGSPNVNILVSGPGVILN